MHTEILHDRKASTVVLPRRSRVGAGYSRPPPRAARKAIASDTRVDWTESEPGFREFVDELRRLLRRGNQRMGLVLLLLLLVTAALVFRQATHVRAYPARIVLGLTENPRVEQQPVTTGNDLRNYIAFGVITDTQLRRILAKHGYRKSGLDINPRGIMELFREEVDIDVFKNEFAVPRVSPDESRSALVSFELWLPDQEQALAIIRDLGDLVIQRDEETRRDRLKIQRETAAEAERVARHDHDRILQKLAETNVELETATGLRAGELHVDLNQLTRAATAAKGELDQVVRQRQNVEFQQAASSESLAAHWDRVDWGSAAIRVDERIAVVFAGIVGIVLLFPLLLIAVGAFNRRLYDERDVVYLGYRAHGCIRTRLQPAPKQRARADRAPGPGEAAKMAPGSSG